MARLIWKFILLSDKHVFNKEDICTVFFVDAP